MSTPEREGNPPTTEGRETAPPGAGSPQPQQKGEEIFDVISGVQSQLEALRRAHAERQKALAALAAQRQQIEEGQRELERRRQEIESARGELNTGSERLKAMERELQQRSTQLDERESRIEQAAGHVAEYEQSLATRTQQLEEQAQQAARLRAEMEEIRTVSIERRDRIQALEARLAEIEQGGSAAEERLARATARVEALSARAQDAEAAVESREKRIQELQAALRESEQASPEAEKEKAELRRLRAQIVEIDKRAKQADERAADLQRELASKSKELEARGKELAEARGAQAEGGKLAQTLEATKKALAERKSEIEGLRKQLEEKEAEAAENLKRGKGAKLEAARAEIEALREKVRTLESGEGGGADPALRQEIERLQRELEAARAQQDEDTGVPVDTATRRRRLRRQKELLRDQTLKLRRAGEALRERHDQCEKILSKRAQLAEAHQAIAEKQAKLANVKARSGAMWLTLGLVTLVGILAGMSWLISGQVAPSEYAARAVVVADGGARELTGEELRAWQIYHEELARDPRLLENVADRLERRGFRDLSKLPALGRLVTENLDTQSPRAGRLEFELRDRGAGRTQRVLDTYVVALASVANQNRVRRADGATTRVDVASEVIPDPIDDTRLYTAGGIFGSSLFMTLVVGVGAWRRMARAKERFERDNRVGVLEDESQWDVPRDA